MLIAGLANPEKLTMHVPGGIMTLAGKTTTGTPFGSANPQYELLHGLTQLISTH